jgi:hypothetical protein
MLVYHCTFQLLIVIVVFLLLNLLVLVAYYNLSLSHPYFYTNTGNANISSGQIPTVSISVESRQGNKVSFAFCVLPFECGNDDDEFLTVAHFSSILRVAM